MNITLKNKIAMAEIKKSGAELISFKKLENNCEYMWNGDAKYWGNSSPVLFPIVCAVNNGEIRVEGNTYKIGNHGFVRKNDFDLVEATENKAVYKHSFDEKTLTMYPFKFDLFITYTLDGNKLEVKYTVNNVDDKNIYFQIGTHPGFNCPIDNQIQFEDYYLEFECEETLERLFMNGSNVLISGKSEMILKDSKILPLSHKIFEEGALVFKNIKSKQITLKNKKTDKNVVLSYENLSNLGLWQPKDAPFICIEPWHGIADLDTYNGEFKDKEMMVQLEIGKSFECHYVIEIT